MARTTFLLRVLVSLVSVPAFGQVDFSGSWARLYHEDSPERLTGPELGDYTELPINDAARLRADSWEADRIPVVQEYRCRPHGADYAMRGLGNIRIWQDIEPSTQRLIAIHISTILHGTVNAQSIWTIAPARQTWSRTRGRAFLSENGKAIC